jgi:cell division septal protein FtsQ
MIRRPSEKRPTPATRGARPGAIRAGVRPGGGMRRTRSVRRASAGLTPVRAGALLVALAAAAALYGVSSSDAFSARRMTVTGTTWTPEADVLAALAVPADQNVFTVRANDLANRLAQFPSIKGASVTVSLPDEVHVNVDERQALVVWKVGDRRFLVDADGLLFAELGENPPEAATALPVIDDAQLFSMQLDVGSKLDPVVLDAALRLGSLTPADVGSSARSLSLRVDDANGFTMRSRPANWTAIFGFYTPTLRTTDLVPGQVRLLRSLLAGREDDVDRIILADDHSGTYIPRATPEPTTKPEPTRKPKPTRKPAP